VADRLIEFVRLGFTGFNFILPGSNREDQARRLRDDVSPPVRAAW
jgi:hypothetical protein